MTNVSKINFMSDERYKTHISQNNELNIVEADDFLIPDYTKAKSISSGYICESRGFVRSYRGWGAGNIFCNGINFDGGSCGAEYAGGAFPQYIFPVKKGDVITYSGSTTGVVFYPCVKG